MKAFNLSSWLGRVSKPSVVVVERDDKETRVDVEKGGRWKKRLILTLEGLAPYSRLTLLDAHGAVIAAKVMDEDADEEAPKGTSEDTEIVVFARLLTEATKDQPILKHAMEFIAKQQESISRYMQECERLRADNNRLRLQIGQLQLTPTEDYQQEAGVMGVLTTIAQGMQAGAALKAQPVARPQVAQKLAAVPPKGNAT